MSLINLLIVVSIFHYGHCDITKAELSEVKQEILQDMKSEFQKGLSNILCHNGGTYLDIDIGFECQCPDGFIGKYCEGIIIQRRGQYGNPEDYFAKSWAEYVSGFGEPGKEFWLGLEKIYRLTYSRQMKLKIVMEEFSGNITEANYASFRLENSAKKYRLRLGSYFGNSSSERGGDCMDFEDGSISKQGPRYFSTHDRDDDDDCSKRFGGHGGWWFAGCYDFSKSSDDANLNGYNYADGNATLCYNSSCSTREKNGIYWAHTTGFNGSLKSVTMSISPINV